MFDRGVDAVHSSQYYYAIELCKSIGQLLTRVQHGQEPIPQAERDKCEQYFHRSFSQLAERLGKELDAALASMSREKMTYNEIRYTSLACHLLFLTKLRGRLTESANEQRASLDQLLARLDSNRPLLNCLVHSFLN